MAESPCICQTSVCIASLYSSNFIPGWPSLHQYIIIIMSPYLFINVLLIISTNSSVFQEQINHIRLFFSDVHLTEE